MESLCDVNETTLLAAWQSDRDYWQRNRPIADDMSPVPRTLGWHGELAAFWLAGYYGARRRALT